MQKNYFTHTLVVLAATGIFLAFVFTRIQYEIYLSQQIQLKKNQDFHNRIRFDLFSCSFPVNTISDPIMQSITRGSFAIDSTYIPDNLVPVPASINNTRQNILVRERVKDSLVSMFNQARTEGVLLGVNSAYRDYARQKRVYENPINYDASQKYATAARPGYSEHQLGTAIDISAPLYANATAINAGYRWLANNAHLYGFTLSYPENASEITKFRYEPWHYRYIGIELATNLKEQGELFNYSRAAFYEHPFETNINVRHDFLSKNIYVGLVSLFGNKTIISDNFIGTVLSADALQQIVTELQDRDKTTISVNSDLNSGQVNEIYDFSVVYDAIEVNDVVYNRMKLTSQNPDDEIMLFIDVVDVPRIYSQILFAYKSTVDQSRLLEEYVLSNCR